MSDPFSGLINHKVITRRLRIGMSSPMVDGARVILLLSVVKMTGS